MPSVDKQKPKDVHFRIKNIRNLGYYENHPDELGLDKERLKKPVNLEVKLTFAFDVSIGIGIKTDIKFFVKQEKSDDIHLFGLKLAYEFELANFRQHIKDGAKKNNKIVNIPPEQLQNFVGFVISGARGMLVALNSIPEYSHIILPPIDTKSLILNNPLVKAIEEPNH